MKDPAGEASVLVQLGQIDLETGRLSDAREELGGAISLIRDTGERRGEASALLGLGMAEAGSGKRDAAVEALTGALRIYQDLSDVSGEAAALFQLGSLAVADGRAHEGMRLMALSAILLRGVRSEEAGGVEPVVERLASQLQYTERQFMDMVQGAIQSYRKDRGWALIRSALFR
ncbi:MAG: tetratricopeptide repeat protein [Methanothrix sp.]|nr:tetratricopeptide repeat protein [Methanothrix sp.]